MDFDSISNELVNFETLNSFDKKSLNRLFNGVEDLCYIYENVNSEEKKAIEIYLTKLSVWIDKNKSKFENYSHKYLTAFDFIQKDLAKIDNIVAQIVTPIKSETIDNWITIYKSSDMFYTIQGNHKDNTQLIKISEEALQNAYKSVRTEKVGSYHIYIMTGHASKDYKEGADGKYYYNKANDLLKKDINEINPSGTLDGEIIDDEERIILFATSDLNMSSQDIAPHLSNSKIFVVVNALFNQNYSPTDTYFNGRKAEQHGTSFLNQFKFTDFSKDELGLLNVLPVMSLINNLKCPNNSYLVSDITNVNPFVIGTDTYFLYKKFRDLGEYEEPEKTQKLMEYYVSYIDKVINKISQINQNFELTKDTLTIFENVEKTIIGILNNFNKSNLPDEIPDNNTLNMLFNSIKQFKETIGLASEENKHNIKLIDGTILDNIDSIEDLKNFFIKRNKKLNSTYQEKEKEKTELTESSLEHLDEILSDFNIPTIQRTHLLNIFKSRQINTKDQSFTSSNLNDSYVFFLTKKDDFPFKEIFKFIEINNDFNNKSIRDGLIEYLNVHNEHFEQDIININDDELLATTWKKITNNTFQCPIKIEEFYLTVQENEKLSVHEIRNNKTLGLNGFFNRNIYYKESDEHSFLNKEGDKSKASSKMLEALGLYDIEYSTLGNLRQQFITKDDLNNSLRKFLSKLKYSN